MLKWISRLFHRPRAVPETSPRTPPDRQQIIAACDESLTRYREREDPDAVCMLCTPSGIYRAVILRKGRLYRVCYSTLHLLDDEDIALKWNCQEEDPSRFGWWVPDGGESWFDDLSEAYGTALAVLAQLEEDGDAGRTELLADISPVSASNVLFPQHQ